MGKIALYCGRSMVAFKFARRMLDENPERVAFVEFADAESAVVYNLAASLGIPTFNFTTEADSIDRIRVHGVTTALLLWWPKIVHEINNIGINVLNTHPSYLPYNRGKYPYYWAIVTPSPFGATIHRVDSGIDTGAILWQKEVEVTPLDTGETLHKKSIDATSELLDEHYHSIVAEEFPLGIEQDETKATSHLAKDLDRDELLELEDYEHVGWLIKDLRARTFDNRQSGRRVKIDGKFYRIQLRLTEDTSEGC